MAALLRTFTTFDQRTEIDIGSGRGQFTLEIAKENPSTRYIGVDINPVQFRISEEARRRAKVANVTFVNADVRNYLADYIEDRSVDAYHFYFPTPYKTRLPSGAAGAEGWELLFSKSFLDELRRTAKFGAVLRFATDVPAYFDQACQLVESEGLVITPWVEPIRHKALARFVGSGCEETMARHGRPAKVLQAILR